MGHCLGNNLQASVGANLFQGELVVLNTGAEADWAEHSGNGFLTLGLVGDVNSGSGQDLLLGNADNLVLADLEALNNL